jgi:hypothetical protein
MIRARAGVLNDATYRREDQATPTALDNGRRSPQSCLRRRRSAARAEGVSPFPDQYRIELIERA